MTSWFKGKGASKAKRYENVESANNRDPFGDVNYYDNDSNIETYRGGTAPVIITVDDNSEAAAQLQLQQKRSWKQRKSMTMFVDMEGEELPTEKPPPTKIGTGDLVGAPNDLNFCCIQDGNLGCLGFGNVVLFNADAENKSKCNKINCSNRTDNEDDDTEKIQSICPVQSIDGSTTGTGNSHQLDRIRSMGAIRDKRESNSVSYYLSQCAPKPSSEKGSRMSFFKGKFRYVLAALVLFFVAMLGGILAVTLRRQKNTKRPNEKGSMIGIDIDKEAEIKSLLDLTPSTAWETEGSPQNMALEWLIYEDPVALSLESNEQIKERFAAATLYFATDGEEWKSSLGFLGENSICQWNIEGVKETIGIFCMNGRVIEINIVNHNLSGSLSNDLNYFSELVVLNLYFNKLTGPIPDLSSLIKLEQLDLDDNQLSGVVPESLFKLPNLANLFLLFNKGLAGTIPDIEESSKLVAISLLGCSFSGTLPKSLGKLSSLRLLQLKGNRIEGRIPQKLLSLPSLETLGLEGNQLTGSIPPVLITEDGTALKNLSMGSNQLEGALPYGLDDLTNLKYMYFENNKLTGSIRNAIMGIPNLERLYLHGNKLSGDLSYFLPESKVLSEVYLGDNDFSGDLNDFLAFAPTSLERLDVSGNGDLEGYISNDIGNFGSLKYFNVSGCSLERRIATEIGRLKNLETLDLSWNKFEGDVPEEMANMVSLNTFDVSRNRDLEGNLSSSVCKKLNDLVYSLADCSGNNARVECDCCTHCCNREGVCGPSNN